MNPDVFKLTLRMLLGRRRTFVLFLLALIPVLIATAFRFSGDDEDPIEFTAVGLFGGVIVAIFLPLAALVFGTAAFGAEAEDGTVVYILARPLARWTVVTAKLAATLVATSALVLPAAIASSAIAVSGSDGAGSLLTGIAVGSIGGTIVYSAVFLCLGILTGRAFVIGLCYVFIWEGVVTNIFSGTRNLSIREYTLGLADALADVPRSSFEANVSAGTAIVMIALVSAVAIWLAIRGAQRFQFGESG